MEWLDPAAPDLTGIVRPGDTVAWGQAGAEPTLLTGALMAQRQAIGRFRAFVGASWSDAVRVEHTDVVAFVSYCGAGRNRALAAAGRLDVWPGHYSALPRELAAGSLKVDVLLLQVAPPDADGRYSLSMACEYLSEAAATAREVVVEVNDRAPFTHGAPRLEPARIGHAVRSSREPLDPPGGGSKADDTEARIAAHVAALIDDGATLQCGIGALPEAILRGLGDRRDLGFHSGAIGDAAARLAEAGVITNAHKAIDRGVSVAGVVMGTRVVRDWVHANARFALRPTAYTHGADVLARIDRFVAINSALEVDLSGQINAEVAGGVYVGAVGGGAEFLRAAARSRGGLPIVALASRAGRGGKAVGRIVARLSGPVSTARSDAGIIVTEHGVADLRGATLAERRRRLIEIAHPDDRAGLEAAG